MQRTTAVYRFPLARRSATEFGRSLRRFLVAYAAVGTKVVNNHLAIGKLNKFPCLRAVPRSEKPAVRSLVVRVVVLGSTICWKLRTSKKQLAIKVASTPLDIAVALHRGAVPVTVAVRLVITTCKIFGIEVSTYSFANITYVGIYQENFNDHA